MIKGLVFDLDGVITETANLHFLAWQKTLKSLKIDYSEEENNKLKGLSRVDTLIAILRLKKIENLFTNEQITEICDVKNKLYLELLESGLSEKNILPGIKNLLKKAKEHNLKMALASSSHNAKKILEKTKLLEFFDFIVDAKKIKKGKPNPEIFITAAQGLNLKPQQCIGFEDSIAGLEGIIQSGMESVAVTNNSSEDFSKADLVLNSTEDLTFELLKKAFMI